MSEMIYVWIVLVFGIMPDCRSHMKFSRGIFVHSYSNTDCSEGSSTDHYRNVPDSVFNIQPNNSPRAFKVVCRMVLKSTFLLKRRFDGAYVNFSRPWQEYKNGFGNVIFSESFWSGLEMIHHVTNNRPHTMRIFVMFQEDGTMLWTKHFYLDFQVSSEKYGYNFTFSSAKSHDVDSAAIEGLSSFLGARFSTYDVDNDNDNNTNCANIHQSGWWFTTCDGYNPTGQPQPPSVQYRTSDPAQLSWPHPLNYSAVKIKMFVVAENN